MPPLPLEQGWSPREPTGRGVLHEELAGDPPQGQESGTPSAQTLTLGPAPPAGETGKGTRAPSAPQRQSRPSPLLTEHPEMPQGAEHTAAGTHPGPSCQASPKHPNPSPPPVMVAKHKTIPLDTLTTFRASNSVASHTVTPVCGHDLCAVPGRSHCPTQRRCARRQSLPWRRLLRFLPTSTGELAPHTSHTWSRPHAAFCGWPPPPCRLWSRVTTSQPLSALHSSLWPSNTPLRGWTLFVLFFKKSC